MSRGTHPLVRILKPAQREHYRAFMDAVRDAELREVVRALDRQTGMHWQGCSKSEMAYYYATAKVPDRLGCCFPDTAKANLKKLAKELSI